MYCGGGAMMLGNLNVDKIEGELGIVIPERQKKEMEACHQERAEDIQPGRWHCFYFPLAIVCGDKNTRDWIVGILSPFGNKMKQQITVYGYDKEYGDD
jgi:hypothetical protein